MSRKNFTQFDLRTPVLTSDYIVGYKEDSSAELRTRVQDIINLVQDSDAQTLSFNETDKNLTITNGNTVSLSALVDSSIDTEVRELTAKYEDTSTVVQTNSASWGTGGGTNIDTAVRDLTGNWESTYTTVQTNSASWGTGGGTNTDTEVRGLTGNWQDTSTTVQTNSASWSFVPTVTGSSVELLVTDDFGQLFNSNNSTEYIVPWTFKNFETDVSVVEGDLTNKNIIIKQPGTYLVETRYCSYDLNDPSSHTLRVRLRGDTSTINSAGGGSLLTTIGVGRINTTDGGFAHCQGSKILRVTTVPYYLAVTFFHTGAFGGDGNQGFPVFNNNDGLQSYFLVKQIN
jgi:hypothetical protein